MKRKFLVTTKRMMVFGCVMALSVSSFAGCGKNKDNAEKPTLGADLDGGEQGVGPDGEIIVKRPNPDAIYWDASKSTEERVKDLMSRMSLEQKVAQMIMAERNAAQGGANNAQVKQVGLGAILSGGGSSPATGNTIDNWAECVNGYKKAAAESELGIPIFYGVDSVHGNNNVYGTTIFPHQIGLGATGNAELVQTIGGITAAETRAMGANFIFSPVLGIPENERWGRFYECFGEDADLVSKMGVAYINGIQGVLGSDEFLNNKKTIASAKHFIGEGQTGNGSDKGYVMLEGEEWNKKLMNELILPYKAAVEAGVQTVMVSYNSVDFVNCHENKELVTDILKGELGFKGFVISDYDGVEYCKGERYSEQLANCVNAGVDMLMEPLDWQNCYHTLLTLVKDGKVSQERIDDAVSRILTVKFDAGLFEEPINGKTETELRSQVGSYENREIARQAVRESITLLKNDKLDSGKTVMQALAEDYLNISVVGPDAYDIGSQCGGWTITWQGAIGDITMGTTIFEGFEEYGLEKMYTYSQDTSSITVETEAVIVVVGETPYAEKAGDRGVNSLKLSEAESALVKEAKEKAGDRPVVVIMLTGRPLTIADELDYMDALVCAWLPGTEAGGIADVIFGDWDFTGTTTVTWPWYAADVTEKFDDESKVLFKPGTGLKKDGTSINKNGTAKIGKKPKK